jgi:tetratricopeptide (TPR) repeat protein
LALLLLAVPGVAHAEWQEASTAHFVVYSNDRPAKLRQFATNLERFDKAIRYLRKFPDDSVGPANRVTVYVVDDVTDVGRLHGDRNVAGFYSPRATGPAAFVPRTAGTEALDLGAMAILLHEYTHHLMYSIGANAAYPRWFSEGYAEFHATARFEKDGSVVIGDPPQYRAWGLMAGPGLPLPKLLQADTLKLNDEQTDALYGRGWLLTHYLTLGGARPGQLSAYIQAINAGKKPLEAAAAFGDLKVLDREIERYKGGRFTAVRIGASALPIGEVKLRTLTAGEAATMNVRIRSKAGVDEKTAPGVYAAAKKACAPYPDDRGAQLVLAEAAYDAGDFAAAEAAADRAIAADPAAVDAFIYKAMARMAVADKAGDRSRETWSAIRKIIVKGNRLDPDDPEPLILNFRS